MRRELRNKSWLSWYVLLLKLCSYIKQTGLAESVWTDNKHNVRLRISSYYVLLSKALYNSQHLHTCSQQHKLTNKKMQFIDKLLHGRPSGLSKYRFPCWSDPMNKSFVRYINRDFLIFCHICPSKPERRPVIILLFLCFTKPKLKYFKTFSSNQLAIIWQYAHLEFTQG